MTKAEVERRGEGRWLIVSVKGVKMTFNVEEPAGFPHLLKILETF